ncbi:hypothetical protein DUNSADRAFT_5179 [Dunaliella salina]|uniref:C2 domain-containing protein n=1 Tax=Dunaliella salina TaxID=3046 RepID=A0ABQ7GQR2_DUNSA|nr:hypothetical protein DUNSADRAFT_5179 [Dunaliella salina]|eukprot:KAF5836950.1 hypothetical protein DUNSADRAFT_5179 [Dunaliella salina]
MQALTFELWDADVIGGDDFVGTCSLPLVNLQPMKPTNLSLPVGAFRSASYAGATSARGSSAVELTRLHVQVQYIPAIMADKSMHSIGVLSMKLEKVHVPSLSILPLYLRPYVTQTNQTFQTSCKPKALRPMVGKNAGRLDIAVFPLPFNCAWDILGDDQQVNLTLQLCLGYP